MLRLERTAISNWEGALRGMRNPMNSWDRSDTRYDVWDYTPVGHDNVLVISPKIGPNDLDLMKRLAAGGPVHAKYRRQIFVSVDVTAPLYWWKEFDTYKVGTVANSCSTMHKIHAKEFSREDFSCDRMDEGGLIMLDQVIAYLESERQKFLADKNDKQSWHNMIQTLPTSFNQMRTVTFSYENLVSIYQYRCNHKLAEWHTFCDWILSLPYAAEVILTSTKENT